MKKLILLSACLLMFGFLIMSYERAKKETGFNPAFSKIRVYNTAENTSWRLNLTDSLRLSPFGQPFETQPCVFVDPGKSFQEFVGIGGALTDASAETFAKIPPDKQQEILQSYFDKEKGIGYSI